MWARGGLSGGGSCGERAAACGRRAYVPYPAVTALALAALAAATAARARRLEYRNRAQVPDPHDQATETGEMSHFDSRLDMSRRTCARLVMAHVLCSKCRFYGEARVQERKQKLLSRNVGIPATFLTCPSNDKLGVSKKGLSPGRLCLAGGGAQGRGQAERVRPVRMQVSAIVRQARGA
jgi:hypothetical protein